jgi:hypothetical protein
MIRAGLGVSIPMRLADREAGSIGEPGRTVLAVFDPHQYSAVGFTLFGIAIPERHVMSAYHVVL